ncbi:META domain-containing protein [Hymenobacter sp. DH14]|uniref:META domain-containing protein n=1 Tax=Hymenobacter cyanobacteriorum TaxID=2926463 RepID=A0A9X1VFQ1_9BACT|nr:META domain-containing protein [Hymenobacter cyanobacteriorum]MCI1187277.1 META domain-containing protein [Hymenobacter cyanobacteriorum]
MRFSFLMLALLAAGCNTRPAQETAATPPPAPTTPDAPLRETRWVLRQLAGQPVSVPANTREAYLTLRADGTAEGNGSCNRFRGSFFSETESELKFSPLMSTRMSCPAIATENAFTTALGKANSYEISGDTLRVLDASGAAVARLEAVYLK